MDSKERKRLSLIRRTVRPACIYALDIVALSDSEWAASVAFKEGNDRRFRFTGGRLIDEASIGDARVG
jgi:hypothetical protein